VDLAEVAAAAIADSSALADSRKIEVGLDAATCSVTGDAQALRTLARNLLDNAVRYTPNGGTVRVACSAIDGRAVLTVEDTGPGIPAADRQRAFDRFYRHPTTSDSGTGLGLAIVKAIAERHGAEVALGDAPGGGLRVTVRFARTRGPLSATS
jgi:signal transduction histidine kinase